MFRLRETFALNDTVERQLKAREILRGGRGPDPTSDFERCVAALLDHPSIEPIARARVFSLLQRGLLRREDVATMRATEQTLRALEQDSGDSSSDALAIGAPIIISPKLRCPSIAAAVDGGGEPGGGTSLPWVKLGSGASLQRFEELCFGGQPFFRYREGASFQHYLLQNLVHHVGLTDERNIERALAGNASWQAKLALRLHRSGVDATLARRAFYDSSVTTTDGRIYDTSYVPKFDVDALVPLRPIEPKPSAHEHLEYYARLDATKESRADARFLDLFATFPFKAGHHVCPNSGQIRRLAVAKPRAMRESTHKRLLDLCSSSNDDSLMQLDFATLVASAVYSSSIGELAAHLLLLHRVLKAESCAPCSTLDHDDNIIRVDGIDVRVPTPDQVFYWYDATAASCDKLHLPLSDETVVDETSVQLVRDIAASCFSHTGAMIACSSYRLLECELHAVFRQLSSDAEKYVFYTLLLQEYNLPMLRRARDKLFSGGGGGDELFGQNPVRAQLEGRAARSCHGDAAEDDDTTFELVDAGGHCGGGSSLWRAFDLYEFTDPLLRRVVETGQVPFDELTPWQLASFAAVTTK